MRPTSCSTSAGARVLSSRSRVGTAVCTRTSRRGRPPARIAARTRAGARRCPSCSRAGRRRGGSSAAPEPLAQLLARRRTAGSAARRSKRPTSIEIGKPSQRMRRPRCASSPSPTISAPANRSAMRACSGRRRRLEAERSAPSSPSSDLGAPREPREQLDRRHRDVQEEADAKVGAAGPAGAAARARGGSREPRPSRRSAASRAAASAKRSFTAR